MRVQHPNLGVGQKAWLNAKVELSTGDVVYVRHCTCRCCVHWSAPCGDRRKSGLCGLTGKKTGRTSSCDQIQMDLHGSIVAVMLTGVADGLFEKIGHGDNAKFALLKR